jgi:hypothetical protein
MFIFDYTLYDYIMLRTSQLQEVHDDMRFTRNYLLRFNPNITIEHLLITIQLQKDDNLSYFSVGAASIVFASGIRF